MLEYTHEIRSAVREWQHTLVGCVVGRYVSYSVMLSYIEACLSFVTKLTVLLNDFVVFNFKFSSEEDIWEVLKRGLWMIHTLHELVLKEWWLEVKLRRDGVKSLAI